MFIDPLYLILGAPGILLGLWAQFKVKSTFKAYSETPTLRGDTGASIAERLLQVHQIHDVRVEPTQGFLSDHYDPTEKVLRLSPDVYNGRSVAAVGVAAHECGHAIQHAQSYQWLAMRSKLVPVLNITSKLTWPAIMGGFALMMFGSAFGQPVLLLGCALFGVMVLFQLITLPVEFDASRRALHAIEAHHLVTDSELDGARRVLSAAALTYVAAAVSSLLTLLYYLIRAGVLGGRDD